MEKTHRGIRYTVARRKKNIISMQINNSIAIAMEFRLDIRDMVPILG